MIGILSLVYALAVNLFLFIFNRRERKLQSKTLAYSFLLIIFIFYFLFLVINPQLYSQPVRGFWQMFSSRWQSAIDYQKQGLGRSVDSKLEGLVLIFEKIFLPGNKFGNFGWLPLIPLDLIVFSLGCGLLVKQIKERLKTKRPLGLQFILATWWWSCFLSLIFYLKNDWSRFYLPLVAATTLIQAYFFSWGLRRLTLIFKQKSRVLPKILKSVKKLKFLA